jgi:Zn-dependent metalloprotease
MPGVEVRVDRDPITQSPKWIASTAGLLTGPAGVGGMVAAKTAAAFAKNDRHRAVKAFLNEHRGIFGHDASALSAAKVAREDVSPTGLRTVVWQQYVGGIPIFDGVLKAGITPRGELVNIGSQFMAAPVAAARAGTPKRARRIKAPQAVALAARQAGAEVREGAVTARGAPRGCWRRRPSTRPA